jgi:chromosome segregation ATPase
MDQELVAFLDERLRSFREELSGQIGSLRQEMSSEIGSLREEMSQGFDQMRTEIRHTHVEIEAMHGTIRLLAEGIVSTNERLEFFQEKVEHDIQEVRALIRPAYSDLNQRVRGLETWRELKERDPVDIIKEKFGLGGPRPSSKE